MFFKSNPIFVVLTFQIINQYLRLGSRKGKLRLMHPLKPLKTINLKDKSFHNSIDGLGFIVKSVSHHGWGKVSIYSVHITGKCIRQTFPPPLHDLMISLHVKQPQGICPKKFVSLCQAFLKKSPYIFWWGKTLSSLTFVVQTMAFQAKLYSHCAF